MNRLCLLVLFCLSALPGLAQPTSSGTDVEKSVQQRSRQVNELWQRQEYRQAVAILEELRALPGLDELEGATQGVFYNLACGYSLLGEKDRALEFLAASVKAGFHNYDHVSRDTDLDNIRTDPRFAAITAPLRAESLLWSDAVWNAPYQDNLSDDLKVAGLTRLWSEIKYGFAFFDRVPNLSWDSLYVAYLPKVRATQTTCEYYRTLQQFAAEVRDGHTSVDVPGELFPEMYSRPPLDTRLIEDRVVITKVLDRTLKKQGLRPGLEITRVDGLPVRVYADSMVAPYQSASTRQGQDLNTLGLYLLCGSRGKPVVVDVEDGKGRTFSVSLERNWDRILSHSQPVEFRSLAGGIAYVALNTFGSDAVAATFDSLLASHESSRALILDLRQNTGGNSSVGFDILGCLTDKPFNYFRTTARTYVAVNRAYGRAQPWQEKPLGESHPNGQRCFTKPVVVLTGAQTGSAAEDFCVAFDVMKRGAIIGEPTCGSTGQPVFFALPGGGHGRVCTVRCTYPDGGEFVGVGVEPDIKVCPTVNDIRAGRDTVLDAALQYLK